jgi:RNA recognition motif-containing protein
MIFTRTFMKAYFNMKIFVAGLPADLDDQELKEIFEAYGQVSSAKVILDRETRKSRCFGFVDYDLDADAAKAMKALNGGSLEGSLLTVKPARDKPAANSKK